MRQLLLTLLVLASAPAVLQAGSVEISGTGGYTFPFYSQSFTYTPGQVSVDIPGLSLDQSGSFRAEASGKPAFGAAVALFPTEALGFELRFDRAGLELLATDSAFRVKATLPAPLTPVEERLSLPDGLGTINSARALSLNLKLRTTGSTRFFASGGLSRLSGLDLALLQNLGLGVVKVDLIQSKLEVATLDLRAEQDLEVDTNTWGGNLGLGFEIPIGEHAGLVLEGRAFYFPRLEVDWSATTTPGSTTVEGQLYQRMLESLPPLEFEPWWAQASAGISIRF